MTLNQILSNVQYGEEYTKYQIVKEGIENSYDEDTGIFYASTRIKNLTRNIVLSESEESSIGRMVAKISAVENKLENGKLMTEAYRKMQAIAIMEDCKKLTNSIENVRKIDSKKVKGFSQIVAAAKYFTESNLDDKAILSESANPLINKYVKEEMGYINQIL